jgi:hypothetical protein
VVGTVAEVASFEQSVQGDFRSWSSVQFLNLAFTRWKIRPAELPSAYDINDRRVRL